MAGFAGGGELELHLLVVHQVCQVVRRRDQAVRLAVADVNPPGGRECTACSYSSQKAGDKCAIPVLLLVVCEVRAVDRVRNPRFSYWRQDNSTSYLNLEVVQNFRSTWECFLALVNTSLEPEKSSSGMMVEMMAIYLAHSWSSCSSSPSLAGLAGPRSEPPWKRSVVSNIPSL